MSLKLKFEQLLNQFLKPNYTVRDDLYLNRLLSHILLHANELDLCTVINEWIHRALPYWDTSVPHVKVRGFILKLLATVPCSNEENFQKLNGPNNNLDRIFKLFDTFNESTSATIKLAYIHVLDESLRHEQGCKWILEQKHWEILLDYLLNTQTVYILREGRIVFTKLLLQTQSIQIIDKLLQNINVQNVINENLEISQNNFERSLTPNLLLLIEIFEYLIKNSNTNNKHIILNIFFKKYELKERLESLILVSRQNPNLLYNLSKIIVLIEILNNQADYFDNIVTVFNLNIANKYSENIFKLVHVCLIGNIEFSDHFLSYQLLPICVLNRYDFTIENEFKLTHTAYLRNWHNFILNQTECDRFQISQKALLYLIKCKQYLNNSPTTPYRTVLICNVLLKNLKYFCAAKQVYIFNLYEKYFGLLLEMLTLLLDEFTLKQIDLNSINPVNIILDFLMINTWSSMVVVKGLKFLKLSLEHFQTTATVDLNRLSTLLYVKLHDSTWEVRDSTLEVIASIGNILKDLPAFETALQTNNLPELILTIACNDGESFVRSTAIRSLHYLHHKTEDLSLKLIKILYNDTESIVRGEVVTLFAHLCQTTPTSITPEVYEVLIKAATLDLHWEVKLKSLEFWSQVIDHYCSTQPVNNNNILENLSTIGCLYVIIACWEDDSDIQLQKSVLKLIDKFTPYVKLENSQVQLKEQQISTNPLHRCEQDSNIIPNFNESIIEEILNTRDIQLLGEVYERQKSLNFPYKNYVSQLTSDEFKRKILVSPENFLQFFHQTNFHQTIKIKEDWMNKIDDLDSLLDDMLGAYDNCTTAINTLDCY